MLNPSDLMDVQQKKFQWNVFVTNSCKSRIETLERFVYFEKVTKAEKTALF